MKEQKKHHTQSPVEPDLFSAAELAEHAMKAAAEEEQAAQATRAAKAEQRSKTGQSVKAERNASSRRATKAADEIEFSVTDTTAIDPESAEVATENAATSTENHGAASKVSSAADKTGNAASKSVGGKVQSSNADIQAAVTTDGGTRKKKKKKKKKKGHAAESNKPKTFFDQIHDFINEDEEQPININVRGLLGGDGLPNFFRRNWLFISIIVIFTCCYVTCRYMMQSAVLEHDKLSEQLIDRRYKNLTLDCELLERTLSSHVEKSLKDSTIHTPTEQAFPLPVEEEEE